MTIYRQVDNSRCAAAVSKLCYIPHQRLAQGSSFEQHRDLWLGRTSHPTTAPCLNDRNIRDRVRVDSLPALHYNI
jgi:hypothetical protein